MKQQPALRNRIRQYVAQKLLPLLGCSNRAFTLHETALGMHNLVFYLDIEAYRPLILKGIRKRDRFHAICSCAAHLAESGIRVPEILYAAEDRRFFGRLGCHIICEERIVGQTLFEKHDAAGLLPAAAQLFAGMHAVTRTAWGPLDRQRAAGLYGHLRGRLRAKLAQWQAADSASPAELYNRILAWIEHWRDPVGRIRVFSLSHGDPNPGNIIVNAENELFLLDTGHIRYLPRAIDYFMIRTHLCRDNPDRIQAFEQAYFKHMQPEDHEDFTETEAFFKLYVFVDFAAMLARRLQHTKPEERYYQEYVEGLAAVRHMIIDITATG